MVEAILGISKMNMNMMNMKMVVKKRRRNKSKKPILYTPAAGLVKKNSCCGRIVSYRVPRKSGGLRYLGSVPNVLFCFVLSFPLYFVFCKASFFSIYLHLTSTAPLSAPRRWAPLPPPAQAVSAPTPRPRESTAAPATSADSSSHRQGRPRPPRASIRARG